MAYVIAASGSDWQEIHIRNTETGQDFDDVLQWCKFSGIAWKSDNSGFFYNRYPAPDTVEATKRGNSDNAVYWHKVGTPQSDDVLVYSSPDDPELAFAPFATDDKEYLCLYVWHGAINRNRIYYRSLDSDDDFIRLLDDADAEYDFVGNDGRNFYVKTDLEASHGRIIAIDLDNPAPENWRTIIPEQDDTIMFSSIINNQLVLIYMHNAYNLVKIYDLDGSFIRDVPLPGIGSIVEFSGSQNDTEMFLHFTSYLYAPTIFRYDFAAHTLTTWKESGIDFPVDEYETEQVFYESKDGTKVSMFITHKKDMPLDGNNPTILYGYGGYSISLTPEFHPQILSWLALGGVYVVANLRGGAEYGEDWHQAGMLENKQNVFDDFIAAGEWLVENRYTSAKKLAIMGGSNGGLLVSVCMIQRPDLFGAVICRVPVTDMLRYHKFTAGRFWTPEYGNAEENPEHFAFMYNYSPLHNVKQDETYPPLLITTADHDDRVVPLHSKKFAATIQEADSGQNPLLLRLDMKAGHGLGKPTTKQIDELTDIHAFLVRTLNIQ